MMGNLHPADREEIGRKSTRKKGKWENPKRRRGEREKILNERDKGRHIGNQGPSAGFGTSKSSRNGPGMKERLSNCPGMLLTSLPIDSLTHSRSTSEQAYS